MTMKRFRVASSVMVVALLAGCNDKGGDPAKQYGSNPDIPESRQYLVPPMSVPQAVGWKEGETPTVPAGLRIQAMANGLMHPRIVYSLSNGDILVVESNGPGTKPFRPKDYISGLIKARGGSADKGGNRITLLRDADGDGVPEMKTVLIDHLHSPYGVAWVADTLYVANTDAIIAYPFKPGQTEIKGPGTKLTDLPAGPINHHWTKSMVASPDGSKLYVGVGSNSNVAESGMDIEEDRAAVFEVDRLTGAKRVYATGIRNPTNLAVQPGTGQLFAVVNGRDENGPDADPDYLSSIKGGGFYGWPYSYWGQHVDDRVHPQKPDMVAKAIKPDYALSSHVAALGVAFSQGQTVSPKFANGTFVGEHGSWNRDPLNGYQVIFVPFVDGRPNGDPAPVVTDFLAQDHKTVRGRPVGLALDRTGALIVTDDVGNTVWRVSGVAATH